MSTWLFYVNRSEFLHTPVCVSVVFQDMSEPSHTLEPRQDIDDVTDCRTFHRYAPPRHRRCGAPLIAGNVVVLHWVQSTWKHITSTVKLGGGQQQWDHSYIAFILHHCIGHSNIGSYRLLPVLQQHRSCCWPRPGRGSSWPLSSHIAPSIWWHNTNMTVRVQHSIKSFIYYLIHHPLARSELNVCVSHCCVLGS